MLIDKTKTVEMLNRKASGWDGGFCWDIILTSIDRYSYHEDTVEELENIRTDLSGCINAIKKNKDEITTKENNPAE